jgi:rare lipoprotein A (peptidoglycan hydrolase)
VKERFIRRLGGALTVALLVGGTVHASAQTPGEPGPIERRLSRARTARERAVVTVQALQASIARLQRERAQVEGRVERMTVELVRAFRHELDASTRLVRAEEALDQRARAAYVFGPTASLAIFLVEDPAQLADAQEFASNALSSDLEAVEAVEDARVALTIERVLVERRKAALAKDEARLAAVLSELEEKVEEARTNALQAGMLVERLEADLAAIRAARRAAERRAQISLDPAAGADQSDLLALLGPTSGRTCQIPKGLQDTGRKVAGDASWYGWDFAGNPTATGAIYDPRLFTAAHRTLPFGTFLRVRWQERCVIVLVNDRGPYGNYERVIDLSLGAAKYLGTDLIGVAPVEADILLPR